MTETTETTTPTPARRRTAALWIGAACVAAMGFILGRTVWGLLIVLLPHGAVPVAWGVAMMAFAWLAGVIGGWWAVAKWSGAMGLCPSLAGWRRRGMELGVVVGVMAAMYLFSMVLGMLAMARMRDSGWDAQEIEMPSEAFVDSETGEPLVAHTETIRLRVGFDLPRGDAELARTAWQLSGDDAADAPEFPENPDCPEPEGAPAGE